ncbi:hypothetical protein HK102_007943 [Quaeritorhiza haematococci]|nr:hypothetical protein HK102_007943 [Quaeritorhiza haematococci]
MMPRLPLDLSRRKKYYSRSSMDYMVQKTDETIVSWSILQQHNIGILHLRSFRPKNVNEEKTLQIIRDLLVSELRDTNGIILDLRDNEGGSLVMVERIWQLFSHRSLQSPPRFRAVVSETNRRIFESPISVGTPWEHATEDVQAGDRYTKLLHLGTLPGEELLDYGQLYLKPIAVFVNAMCYSACELLTAMIQDQGIGRVYGEDPQTGGGGANVVDVNGFLNEALPEVFEPLPNGQNMRVGWRQVVRMGGENDGKLIEDYGVSVDETVRPTARDFEEENSVYSPVHAVASQLLESGITSGRSYLTFVCSSYELLVTVGSPFQLKGSASWLTRLELHHKGELIDHISFPPQRQDLTAFELNFATSLTHLHRALLTIKGYVEDEQVLQTQRFVRIVPPNEDYLSVTANSKWTWDFVVSDGTRGGKGNTDSKKFVGVYNMNHLTRPEDGWQILPVTVTENSKTNKQLVIGNGAQHENNLSTTFSMFLDLAAGTKPTLIIKGGYETEAESDYFSILVRRADEVATRKESELAIISGAGELDEVFDLSAFAGSRVEVMLRFVSDEAVTYRGVYIDEVSVES